ncbi:MAG TPA: penicillin-binding protein 2 [Dictyobacter sp.]|nr:penicillin-binding protein 2 [Dictyobacter sp.]
MARWANAEHTQSGQVNAPRGNIYDVNGLLLATNIVRDDVYVDPAQIVSDNPNTYEGVRVQLAQKLHRVLTNVPVTTLEQDLSLNVAAVPVAVSITPAQSAQLSAMQLPYTFLQPRTWRDYPQGDAMAQILGYVQDTTNTTPHGVYGIERSYDQQLAGKPGSFTTETDLNGNPLTVGASSSQQPVPGSNITLTIDSDIQYQLQTELDARVKQTGSLSGSAVVVDARTGAIVAMAGSPTFDPNNYGQYASQKGCLNTEEVYMNPVLYCEYEPGSTMKVITMAAALDQHKVTPSSTINDPGYVDFSDGTPRVTNWDYPAGHGKETMTQVLEYSSNVGASIIGHNYLGPQGFYPYVQRFGFGQCTGLFAPESCGSYSSPQDNGWSPSDLARQSFGQSILVTPIQMAMAYEAVANNGVMMKPYIVSEISSGQKVTNIQPQVSHQVISAQADQELVGMLKANALYNKGEASVPGYQIAFKSGTATTQGLSMSETEASLAGFIPATDPRFVILVKLDHPDDIFGGNAAGPLWSQIAQQLMLRYNIPPDQQP